MTVGYPKKPPAKPGASRKIAINAVPHEWDPLFAYADSMGITPNQAAAELLLASLTANVGNATFIAAARRARHDSQKIIVAASLRAVGSMWQEFMQKAIELGIEIDDSHKVAK